jgi:hypothetical protein
MGMLDSVKRYTGYEFVKGERLKHVRHTLQEAFPVVSKEKTILQVMDSAVWTLCKSESFASEIEELKSKTGQLNLVARVICRIAQAILFWWNGVGKLAEQLKAKADSWHQYDPKTQTHSGKVVELIWGNSLSNSKSLGVRLGEVDVELDGGKKTFGVYARYPINKYSKSLGIGRPEEVILSLSESGIAADEPTGKSSTPSISWDGRRGGSYEFPMPTVLNDPLAPDVTVPDKKEMNAVYTGSPTSATGYRKALYEAFKEYH